MPMHGLCGAVDKVGMTRTTRTGRQGQLFGFYSMVRKVQVYVMIGGMGKGKGTEVLVGAWGMDMQGIW
jgi:hypothetical protein